MGDFVATGARALRKWGARAARLHPRMEITGEGLVLGAGTILAKMARDESGAPLLSLDDEPRIYALLSTGFEKPAGPRLLTKIRRACEIWNEGEKATAAPEARGGPQPSTGRADASIILESNEKERDYDERRARGEESPKEDIEHGRGVPLLPEGPLALPLLADCTKFLGSDVTFTYVTSEPKKERDFGSKISGTTDFTGLT